MLNAIIDTDEQAPGIIRAKKQGIAYGMDWRSYLTDDLHIIFDVTGDKVCIRRTIKSETCPYRTDTWFRRESPCKAS